MATGKPFDYNAAAAQVNASAANVGKLVDPRTTEDCLFLDVHVPKAIFDAQGQGKGAPVLVWYAKYSLLERELYLRALGSMEADTLKATKLIHTTRRV